MKRIFTFIIQTKKYFSNTGRKFNEYTLVYKFYIGEVFNVKMQAPSLLFLWDIIKSPEFHISPKLVHIKVSDLRFPIKFNPDMFSKCFDTGEISESELINQLSITA